MTSGYMKIISARKRTRRTDLIAADSGFSVTKIYFSYRNTHQYILQASQIWYHRMCFICLLIQWLKNWHAVIWKQTSLLCLSHTHTGRTDTLLLCESVNGGSVTDTHHTTHCSDMQLTNTTIITLSFFPFKHAQAIIRKCRGGLCASSTHKKCSRCMWEKAPSGISVKAAFTIVLIR